MKRGTFGAVLLAALFFLCLSEMRFARRELKPMAGQIRQAAEAAALGDYEKTAALTEKAGAAWEKCRGKFSCLSQQQAVRDIDGLYDEVRVFLLAKEQVHCAAACENLKNHLLALLEDQKLCFANLL